MFENIISFFKRLNKKEEDKTNKETAKERLHLVLMQDRANVSADFLDMMKQEIIEVIKKYIDVDEGEIDVKLTNKQNSDGTTGAPALYANIPIISIKNEARKIENNKNEKKDNNEIKENNSKEAEKNKEEISQQKNEQSSKVEKDSSIKTEKIQGKKTKKNNKKENILKNPTTEKNTVATSKEKIEEKDEKKNS